MARPYVCTGCGAGSKAPVKLWREYNTFANNTFLYCADCCTRKARRKPEEFGPIREDGKCLMIFRGQSFGFTDQAGDSMVPAIPDGEGSFWGYTSVPQDRCEWWRALPLVDATAEVP